MVESILIINFFRWFFVWSMKKIVLCYGIFIQYQNIEDYKNRRL